MARVRSWSLWLPVCAVAAVSLAACGSSGSGDSGSAANSSTAVTTPGPTTESGGASSSASGGSGFTLDRSLNLALMWEVKGESAYGIDSINNGAMLAIEMANAAGGVGGKPITSFRVPADVADPAKLTSQVLQAQGKKPDAMIGFVSPVVDALTRQIDSGAIPVMGIGSYAQVNGLPVGSKWFFQFQAEDDHATQAAVKFVTDDLKLTKVAILHSDESFGTAAGKGLDTAAKAAKLDIITNTAHSVTATDLTSSVVASKGAQVALDFTYPNPLAIQIKQFAENRLNIPTISGSSASTVATTGLVSSAQLANLYGVQNCNPYDTSRAQTKTFFDAYKAKYHVAPDLISETAYDGVNLVIAAVNEAKSTDHDKVRAALAGLKYTNGACAPDLHADKAQVFNHQQVAVTFAANGTATSKQTFTFPDDNG